MTRRGESSLRRLILVMPGQYSEELALAINPGVLSGGPVDMAASARVGRRFCLHSTLHHC
jgi:hypothetical protein